MNKNITPVFDIIDIIQLKRENSKQKTVNKPCYVLSCRISGESLFFYHDKQLLVKKGELLYIPEGATYTQKCEKEEIICFHLEAFSKLYDEISIFKTENSDEICKLFTSAAKIWNKKDKNYKYKCMAIFYEVLSLCDISFSSQNTNQTDILKKAIEYIDTHIFDADLSIKDLCDTLYISRTYFNKLFKKIYKYTPIQYINKERIKKAKFLLKSGDYTNEEIAQLCGFNDVKYFYVVFKKITGLTTKEYKSLH